MISVLKVLRAERDRRRSDVAEIRVAAAARDEPGASRRMTGDEPACETIIGRLPSRLPG